MVACALAALGENDWVWFLRPPTSMDAPRTSSALPRIDPMTEPLTTS